MIDNGAQQCIFFSRIRCQRICIEHTLDLRQLRDDQLCIRRGTSNGINLGLRSLKAIQELCAPADKILRRIDSLLQKVVKRIELPMDRFNLLFSGANRI